MCHWVRLRHVSPAMTLLLYYVYPLPSEFAPMKSSCATQYMQLPPTTSCVHAPRSSTMYSACWARTHTSPCLESSSQVGGNNDGDYHHQQHTRVSHPPMFSHPFHDADCLKLCGQPDQLFLELQPFLFPRPLDVFFFVLSPLLLLILQTLERFCHVAQVLDQAPPVVFEELQSIVPCIEDVLQAGW